MHIMNLVIAMNTQSKMAGLVLKMDLELLPEDCFSLILSLTSPRDTCRLSSVSSAIRSSADSDIVWNALLPPDYHQILSRLSSPVICSSKKELFFRLCDPHLIDGATKIFSLEKATGKKRYMLSARELSITWGTNPLYWSWKPLLQSRFSEAVELRTIWWLQIHGKFNTSMLSSNTNYGAYLIVKFAARAYGLDTLPSKVSVQVGDFKLQGKVYLRHHLPRHKQVLDGAYPLNRAKGLRSSRIIEEEETVPCLREDGWLEIELGSFYNDVGDDKEVHMSLEEVTGVHLKGGLIVEGIELRPKE